jgi:hypothetical protein
MGKAILILDMPEKCGDCKLCTYNAAFQNMYCPATEKYTVVNVGERHPGCPLQPIGREHKALAGQDEME